MGGKQRSHANEHFQGLTSTCRHQAKSRWLHEPVYPEHSSSEEAMTMTATEQKNELPYQSACECFKLQ